MKAAATILNNENRPYLSSVQIHVHVLNLLFIMQFRKVN